MPTHVWFMSFYWMDWKREQTDFVTTSDFPVYMTQLLSKVKIRWKLNGKACPVNTSLE